MKQRRTIGLAGGLLALLHGVVLAASFVAPYDFAAQHRDLPYAPPTRLHWVDARGKFHLRPFVYRWVEQSEGSGNYVEDTSQIYGLHFLTGPRQGGRRLFGVDEPARIFLLGTDAYGRDQFSRLLYGGRISLLAGALAAALTLGVGLMAGAAAGCSSGWLDSVIMRGAELFLALPWLYLLFAIRAFLPLHISPSQAFFLLIAVIGMVGWARPARLVRSVVLSAKERTYVLAARSFGASHFYLLRRHILPQTLGVLVTQAAILIPQFVLAEVTLSFLGLGVGEPVPSWGNMLAALQQYSVLTSYWWMFLPALALVSVFWMYHKLADCLLADCRT